MESEPADDAELLSAWAAGDGQAFARLYDRYDRPCFSFIRRMVGSIDAAEDLHQDTWMAVSRNASSFDPEKAVFRAWLFTIARNKVLDHFRRRKTAAPAAADEDERALELAPDPGPSPLAQVESRELAEQVVGAVEALPLEQRATFVMFAHAGLSLEEIAAATDVPVETAKSRLRYARARLRQALAGVAHA